MLFGELVVHFRFSVLIRQYTSISSYNTVLLYAPLICMVSNIRYGVCIQPPEYGASNTDIVLLRTLIFRLVFDVFRHRIEGGRFVEL